MLLQAEEGAHREQTYPVLSGLVRSELLGLESRAYAQLGCGGGGNRGCGREGKLDD
jgi:hypothetical protein